MSVSVADDVLYEVAKEQLSAQLQTVDALDAKGATVFTFSSGILAFFGATFSLGKPPQDGYPRVIFFLLLALSLVSYVVTLYFTFKAYSIGEWSMRPDLEELDEYCQQYPSTTMHIWVAQQCQVSIAENIPKLRRKTHYLTLALGSLPFEAVTLALASAISLMVQRGT